MISPLKLCKRNPETIKFQKYGKIIAFQTILKPARAANMFQSFNILLFYWLFHPLKSTEWVQNGVILRCISNPFFLTNIKYINYQESKNLLLLVQKYFIFPHFNVIMSQNGNASIMLNLNVLKPLSDNRLYFINNTSLITHPI